MGRSPRGSFGGARHLAAVLCAVLLILPSCTRPEPPAPDRSPPASDARPLRAAPDVQHDGFAPPPPGSGLSRYSSQRLDWQACPGQLQCTTVLVPLDYSQPDGTAITLSLAKKPASAGPRRGSLFINPGGPGASGVDYVGYFRSAGLESYDVIGWDPRGVGRSTPVYCSGVDLQRFLSIDISPDDEAETAALVDANRDFGTTCLNESGALLEHVSTVEVARDLDLLRSLVGDDRLNFFGASYGTQVGATYAQLFPRRVGRMVLDGAVNITADTSVSQAEGFERALDAFASWCAARRCSLGQTRAEVLRAVVDLWRGLDQTPMPVGGRQLSQQQAVVGVISALYGNQASYPFLLRGLEAAITRRDGKLLLLSADNLAQRNADGTYGQINFAFPAVRCLDARDRGVQGELEQAVEASKKAPTIGPFFGSELLQCSSWPLAPVATPKLVASGAPPILVIGTTGDPATPYEHAVTMAKQLSSGVLLTFRGQGHTAYGQSSCVQQRVDSFLNAGVVPSAGTVC